MIQANLLLGVSGRVKDSFVVLDLMRLPLGILSGMGFIGAGAILRRGNLVLGVTTAATLWFATVMGLCFGGGQIGLGLASLGVGVFVLGVLIKVEARMHQDRQAVLTLKLNADGPTEDELRAILREDGYRVLSWAFSYSAERSRQYCCTVSWRALRTDTRTPVFLTRVANRPGVLKFDWKPEGSPEPGLQSSE